MSIRRNTALNLLGAAVPLLLTFLTVPLYLPIVGEARYGVLAIAWLLLGYFGVFDLGLGRATAQRIASVARDDARALSTTFWTAVFINLCMGMIGGCALYFIADYAFAGAIAAQSGLRAEIDGSVFWLALAVPMATLSGVLAGALQGRERFLQLNLVSAIGSALFQLLPLATAMGGLTDLRYLLPAALLAKVLTLLAYAWQCRTHVTQGQSVRVTRAEAAHLTRFGGWVTVSAVVGPLMVILDRFAIGLSLGAKAVTFYTVPFSLAERSALLARSFAAALFPRLAAVSREHADELARNASLGLAIAITPISVLAVALIEPFLAWWISPALADRSAAVGQILCLAFWINSLAMVPYAVLQARGRPDIVARCHLAEVLPYLGLLYLALTEVGIFGAAVVFTLRVAVDYFLLASFAGMLGVLLKHLLVPSLVLLGALALASVEPTLTVRGLLGLLLLLILAAVWGLRTSLTELGLAPADLLSRLTFGAPRAGGGAHRE